MNGRRLAFLIVLALSAPARAHDIPNARVDRSIQATIRPGRLEIDYEVSLSELTLTQDLRALIGAVPGADRRAWFDRYGRETGPMNAKGFLVAVDGTPVALHADGFDLAVEEHPRYTFRFSAPLPARGRLTIQDANFVASEGTSRLAIRGRAGVTLQGDDLPSDVNAILIRPVWQLTDEEETRTRQVAILYTSPEIPIRSSEVPQVRQSEPARPTTGLTWLLDRSSGLSAFGLALLAFGLGAAHAFQPGHGKLLVTAAVLGDGGRWLRGAVLAAILTITHTGSVLLVAVGLWWFHLSRYGDVNRVLAQVAGIGIAAVGLWRLGRHLAGYGEHDQDAHRPDAPPKARGLIGLGVAGGLVPCWDAIGLIVLAEAVGRMALGIGLLVAFGLGMAAALALVGAVAAQVRRFVVHRLEDGRWERRLGIASGLALTIIGLSLWGWS